MLLHLAAQPSSHPLPPPSLIDGTSYSVAFVRLSVVSLCLFFSRRGAWS